MTRASAGGQFLVTRMASLSTPDEPPPPSIPVLSLTSDVSSLIEAQDVIFTVHRAAPFTAESRVDWAITSSNDTVLDIDVPRSGNIIFPAGSSLAHPVTIETMIRDGTQGDRTLTFTLSNPVNASLGTPSLGVTLQDFIEPPPPASDLPTPKLIINIANNSQLDRLNGSTVVAGTHYLLAPGNYTSAVTLSKNVGTAADPVVIRALNGVGTSVKWTGAGKIKVTAPFTWVYGMDFTGGGNKVTIEAPNVRVGRNYFHDFGDTAVLFTSNGKYPNCRIDHNEFRKFTTSAIEYVLKSGVDNQNIMIERNYYVDHTIISETGDAVVQILTQMFEKSLLTHRWCLFENVHQSTLSKHEHELISTKTGYVTFDTITFVDCHGGELSLRETRNCKLSNIWMDASCDVLVHGDHHVLDRIRGSGKTVRICSGDAYDNGPNMPECGGKQGRTVLVSCTKTAHCSCRGTVVKNTIGEIYVGDRNDGTFRVTDTTLQNNEQHYKDGDGLHDAPTETGTPSSPTPPHKVVASEVGPLSEL